MGVGTVAIMVSSSNNAVEFMEKFLNLKLTIDIVRIRPNSRRPAA